MTKLNQIIAVVSGKKTKSKKDLTTLYKTIQKSELFNGFVRVYTPKDEDGDTLPQELTSVRVGVNECVDEMKNIMGNMLDLVYTQDKSNTDAIGDIIVDGKVIATDVPVTYLMFLEKQLIDIKTFIENLPTLDEAYTWDFDDNKGRFVSNQEIKNRDIKSIEHKVIYEATENHPAQIAEVSITKKVGEFTTTKMSGAIGITTKNTWLNNVEELQNAVKFAREQANSLEVKQHRIASSILDFVF